jgi:hypothetical protein
LQRVEAVEQAMVGDTPVIRATFDILPGETSVGSLSHV